MANAKLSVLATQFATNAAAIATAASGSIVTSDITALADLLKTLSLRNDLLLPALYLANPANSTTQLTPG